MTTVKVDPIRMFDSYRQRYQSFTFDEHREFYNLAAQRYPDQIGFSIPHAAEFFRYVQPKSVVELGGWDGRMAHLVGTATDTWINYELADVPQFCEHVGYRVVLDQWAWEAAPLEADAFVSSHALEHLSHEHLALLMDALACEWAYIEIPLEAKPTDWRGYYGAHVLPLSIGQFDALWRELGWEIVYSTMLATGFVRWFRR